VERYASEMHASFEKYSKKSVGCKDDAAVNRAATNANHTRRPEAPQSKRYWESMDPYVARSAKKLRFGNEGKPCRRRSFSQEWQQQLTDYLRQLGEWVLAKRIRSDYYHQNASSTKPWSN